MLSSQVAARSVLLLLLAGASSVAAQPLLEPFGEAVEVDRTCTYSPAAIEVDGQVVAVWKRLYDPHGIWARSGPSLAELGPETMLTDQFAFANIQVAAAPGHFVVAWARPVEDPNSEIVFQRFGLDLAPQSPEVVVGTALEAGGPSLLVGADGSVTVAFFAPSGTVRVRRYSAADLPLTPLIDVAAANPDPYRLITRLAAGDDHFLVAWEGSALLQAPGFWVRGYASGGNPLADPVRVAALAEHDIDVAWAQDSYLAAYTAGAVRGRRLAPDGALLGQDLLLAQSPHAFGVDLAVAADGNSYWLTYGDESSGIHGARIALPDLVASPPQQLVPRPEPEAEFVAPTATTLSGDGFLLSWVFGNHSALLSPPCQDGRSVHGQIFGPAAPLTVEVPAATPAGLTVLIALLATAALALLRRG